MILTDTSDKEDSTQKIRVENNSDSIEQSFEIQWMNGNAPVNNAVVTRVQVPANQVRILTVPKQPSGSDRLVFVGRRVDGDNEAYAIKPTLVRQRILFVGSKVARKKMTWRTSLTKLHSVAVPLCVRSNVSMQFS